MAPKSQARSNKRTLPTVKSLTLKLSGQDGSGEHLYYDSVYHDIRQARQEDDQRLSQGIWETDQKKADWRRVEDLCMTALRTRSKDLQLAGWLTESWINLDGLDGLSQGFKLLAELCEQLWSTLYPQAESQDFDHRLHLFEWFEGMALQRLIDLPLTGAIGASEAKAYRVSDWVGATAFEATLRQSKSRGKAFAPSKDQVRLADVMQALRTTPKAYLRKFVKSATACEQNLAHLKKVLEQKEHFDAPSFRLLSTQIGTLKALVQPYSKLISLKKAPFLRGEAASESVEPKESNSGKDKEIALPIRTRKEAYQMIGKIASYLESLEPHSPTPHLLRNMASWEHKTLSEIFQGISDDPKESAAMIKMLVNNNPQSI